MVILRILISVVGLQVFSWTGSFSKSSSVSHPSIILFRGKNHLKHYCERKKKHSSCLNCSMQLPTHCPALQYGKAYKLRKGMAIATTQIQQTEVHKVDQTVLEQDSQHFSQAFPRSFHCKMRGEPEIRAPGIQATDRFFLFIWQKPL